MKENDRSNALFMGLDSSTQGLKATIIDRGLSVVSEETINFDRDLPEFNTHGGVHQHEDGLTVTSPPLMWVAALDKVLDLLREGGCPFERIAAVSGSGQQHGSVWLHAAARDALRHLTPGKTLASQLADVFAVTDSPVWMDSSTARQCEAREAAMGGAQALAEVTGSRAYERFTGNQIARICENNRSAYEDTDRIALVSSFVASLLIGDHAPIDASDGSGMNIMNIRTKKWDRYALDCTAPDLSERLGPIVPSHTVVGRLHHYYAGEFGFSGDCLVVAFSGDNPNSLAGLRLQHPGDIAVSMGTSDTVFGSLSDPRPSAREGHVFVNPVDPDAYMAMICIKNGSLTRESVRNEHAEGSWDRFAELLDETQPGNNGRIGFFFREPEITPPVFRAGITRFDGESRMTKEFGAAADARAVLEGQFLSMRLHCGNIGLKPRQILATGGASVNKALIRIMADVFGVAVSVAEKSDSASLGAAYRALHGWTCERSGVFVPYGNVLAQAPPFEKMAEPDMGSHEVYSRMLSRYAKLERIVAGDI